MQAKQKILAVFLAAACTAAASLTVLAATEHWNDASKSPADTTATYLSDKTAWTSWVSNWDNTKVKYEQVALTPGADETQMNFGWYSRINTAAIVKLSTTPNMANAVTFTGSCEPGTVLGGTQYYSSKVTATGLKADTTYYYQANVNGVTKPAESFRTGNSDSFSMLLVGDPQIGASVGQTASTDSSAQTAELAARNDSFNWNKTLNSALASHSDIDFILSAGDQINEYVKDGSAAKLQEQEYEYAGFLSAKALRSLPIATTIGNHDSLTTGYRNHFNNPNSFVEEQNPTKAGNGYYFSYGNALFVVLNSNNYNCADHKALIEKAVKSDPDAKWRIVMFHQDIYGTGLDHSDSDGIILRTQLTPIFDSYDIDVVLQGHDHTYSRSYQLSGDGKEHASYDKSVDLDNAAVKSSFLTDNLCYNIVGTQQGTVTNPAGTVYFSTNSSTGSKFYELIPTQQNYIAARSQTWKPSYSVLRVEGNTFSIDTYDAETGKCLDANYTIVKTR